MQRSTQSPQEDINTKLCKTENAATIFQSGDTKNLRTDKLTSDSYTNTVFSRQACISLTWWGKRHELFVSFNSALFFKTYPLVRNRLAF